MSPVFDHTAASQSIVTVVPTKGRGFVVEINDRGRTQRLVITAAHCLPKIPEPGPNSPHDRIFFDMFQGLDGGPLIAAHCLFADVISDLVVLGAPDSEQLPLHNNDYQEFVDSFEPLAVAGLPGETGDNCDGWLFSLAGEWFPCTLTVNGGPIWMSTTTQPIIGGMSGSPILRADGRAVGVVSTGTEDIRQMAGPQPHLIHDLPGWMLAGLASMPPRLRIVT